MKAECSMLVGLEKEEGMWSAEGWLAAHPEFAGLNAREICIRARQISAGLGLTVGRSYTGGYVVSGLAMRMAAETVAIKAN